MHEYRPNDIITQLVADTKVEQSSEMQANKRDNLHSSTAKTAITEIKQMTIRAEKIRHRRYVMGQLKYR